MKKDAHKNMENIGKYIEKKFLIELFLEFIRKIE